MPFEYASTSTSQKIGTLGCVGKAPAIMVTFMFADSGLPKFLLEELMLTVAFLGNRALYFAISMWSLYKIPHGIEPVLRLLQDTGARAFANIEARIEKLKLKAVEGRRVGYINISKSYHFYNPATRRTMERRNVIFIETPSRLLPPSSAGAGCRCMSMDRLAIIQATAI